MSKAAVVAEVGWVFGTSMVGAVVMMELMKRLRKLLRKAGPEAVPS